MKKALIIIGIVLSSLLLLGGSLVGILHIKSVQTYIVGKVAGKFSEMIDAEVSIAQFHYKPLSHLTIDSVYLSDQKYDTLAFIEQLDITFQPLELKNKKMNF